jgi:predicted DNA-binding transcriptional regulator YafY
MNHYYKKISVKELANYMGVTVRTAERYFKELKNHG